jgi:hypothetical protein
VTRAIENGLAGFLPGRFVLSFCFARFACRLFAAI